MNPMEPRPKRTRRKRRKSTIGDTATKNDTIKIISTDGVQIIQRESNQSFDDQPAMENLTTPSARRSPGVTGVLLAGGGEFSSSKPSDAFHDEIQDLEECEPEPIANISATAEIETDVTPSSTRRGLKRLHYTIEFKLSMIEKAKKSSNREVAR